MDRGEIKILHFTSQNCGVCTALKPKLEEISSNHGIIYEEIEVEKSDITNKYSVFSAPTILLLVDGREYLRENGYLRVDDLNRKIIRVKSLIDG